MALLAAACGGGTLESSTAPLEDGTRVSPRSYLADTAAAAEAVSDFVVVTRSIGDVARAPRLREVAPELREPLARATALARRLDAARLEDARLEEQRRLAAAALGQVVRAMERTTAAADAANPVRRRRGGRGPRRGGGGAARPSGELHRDVAGLTAGLRTA